MSTIGKKRPDGGIIKKVEARLKGIAFRENLAPKCNERKPSGEKSSAGMHASSNHKFGLDR